jgi:hypothetical protein
MPDFMKGLSVIILCSLPLLACGQKVITLPIHGLDGPNGFVLDKNDRLIIATEKGKRVVLLKNDSTIERKLVSDSPDGLAFNRNGVLHISNFYSGTIMKYVNGEMRIAFTGLSQPSDIKFDRSDNLYVSEYDKNVIVKISPDGTRTIAASGIQNPSGLAVSAKGDLFVASNATGELFRVNNGKKELIAQLPGAIAYIAYSEKTENIYAVCYTCHKVYRISKNGEVTILLGQDVKGYRDGDLKVANVENPNSIALSSTGDIYLSEISANRIRKIIGVE